MAPPFDQFLEVEATISERGERLGLRRLVSFLHAIGLPNDAHASAAPPTLGLQQNGKPGGRGDFLGLLNISEHTVAPGYQLEAGRGHRRLLRPCAGISAQTGIVQNLGQVFLRTAR